MKPLEMAIRAFFAPDERVGVCNYFGGPRNSRREGAIDAPAQLAV
jgi:hypothetical protein